MGILCPIVGSYLIVQRMALLGDVVAHCVLPGLSVSYFLGIDILIGAFTSGLQRAVILASSTIFILVLLLDPKNGLIKNQLNKL